MSYDYTNENGKSVHGPAALVHYVYIECGGLDAFIESVQRPAPIVKTQNKDLLKPFAIFGDYVTRCITSIWIK